MVISALSLSRQNLTKGNVMTDAVMGFTLTDEEMEERVRPLVNDILERFNQENISPSEAGMVILSLTYRLLGILEEAPEARRFFILTLINLINNVLTEGMEGKSSGEDQAT
jgi:hypothetical protein